MKYRIGSVANALTVLETLAAEGPKTLASLSAQLEIPLPSLFRLVATLEERGYLVSDDGKQYKLGLAALKLGAPVLQSIELYNIVGPALRQLMRRTGETAECGVLDPDQWGVLVIAKVDSDRPIRLVANIGILLELHTVALGKVLLAKKPDEEVDRFLIEYGLPTRTSNTIIDPQIFRVHLGTVRQLGYAVDDREAREEVSRIAAPVIDANGVAVGAVGVAGPAYRFNGESKPALVEAVLSCAYEVSNMIGTVEPRWPDTGHPGAFGGKKVNRVLAQA